MVKTIMIVDDDPNIVDLLKLYLNAEGYITLEALDGKTAFDQLKNQAIDLAIIDIMMPIIDGYELLKMIRQEYKIPVILLSAKNQDYDKITGLKLGADDYISKPFSPLEVVARIQAQLRRFYEFNDSFSTQQSSQLKLGHLLLSHRECVLYIKDKPIPLSAREYELLKLLMSEPGRVFTKKQIFERAWNEYYIADDNAIMVQISRIREKIEECPRKPVYIKTIRGLGYRFAKKDELTP
ncbi:response regulator transcription factor [Lysinibacillus irui]|uniref:Response regulator transcription factor n=1 Tax=Lysinibacillus irui TaxID=2998077 RepID=A0ABU5NHW0_9BACI|nr:response regulator transcription factor [Lysinibacillus irui]MEA0553053.1 response regulator transcription factor [Lysinibacillus irui]MEA0975633.1 response regulator transcription factor [Lysinibacillus irui]MEA1041787.1 response regulator transcription factor [Lysinibacillus irui]